MADEIDRTSRLTGQYLEESKKLATRLRNVARAAIEDLPGDEDEPSDDTGRYERVEDRVDVDALFADL